MRKHHSLFSRLPEARKRDYQAIGSVKAEDTTHVVDDELIGVVDACAHQHKRRRQEEEAEMGRCVVSACRFGEADFKRLAELWDDKRFAGARVEALQNSVFELARAPLQSVQNRLAQMGDLGPPPPARQPSWCDDVCRRRDHLKHALVSWFASDGERAFLFLFALQQPMTAAFLPATRSLAPESGVLGGRTGQRPSESDYDHVYTVDWTSAVLGRDINDIPEDARCFVILDFVSIGESSVCSNGLLIPWGEFLEACPAPAPSRSESTAGKSASRPKAPTELLPEFPWLRKYVNETQTVDRPTSSRHTEPNERPEPVALDDEQLEQVYNELEKKRAEWAQEYDPDITFRVRVLGGKWTKENLRVAADAVGGHAATETGKEFCKSYKMGSSMRFNFNKYGEVVAAGLAKHWCERMEYWFGIWFEQPRWDFEFSEELKEGALVNEALMVAASDLPLEHPVWDALAKINAVSPAKLGELASALAAPGASARKKA